MRALGACVGTIMVMGMMPIRLLRNDFSFLNDHSIAKWAHDSEQSHKSPI